MQPRTNGKFLHKYVKNANSQWTALICSKKSGITTTYFWDPQKVVRAHTKVFHKILCNPEQMANFLHKYVKIANGQWTALICWKKSGNTTTYFWEPQKVF